MIKVSPTDYGVIVIRKCHTETSCVFGLPQTTGYINLSFLVAKTTQAFTAICNSVSHTFCVPPHQPITTHHSIKSNHHIKYCTTVQSVIIWWLDLILYTSYRPSMMKSSANERAAWWNHQPMREQHYEIISQWESSMMKFNSLLEPCQIQFPTKTIPNSTPFLNH